MNPVGIDVLKIPGRTSGKILRGIPSRNCCQILEELLYKYQRKFFKDKRLGNQV